MIFLDNYQDSKYIFIFNLNYKKILEIKILLKNINIIVIF